MKTTPHLSPGSESDIFPGIAESPESLEDTIRGIKDAGIDFAYLFTVKFGVD